MFYFRYNLGATFSKNNQEEKRKYYIRISALLWCCKKLIHTARAHKEAT